MMFVRVYPRETQEMVFDAHDRAFALFKGTCGRGIYDNMKTAVETVFVGKDRLYNRRFLQMCSHYVPTREREGIERLYNCHMKPGDGVGRESLLEAATYTYAGII